MFEAVREGKSPGASGSIFQTGIISHLKLRPDILSSILRPNLDLVPLHHSQADRLRSQSLWFVHLRWLAVFMALTLVLTTGPVLGLLPQGVHFPLLSCVILLALCNIAFWHLSNTSPYPYQLILIQAVLDLTFLTLFLHFSGGLENPLFTLYILHVILAGILMTPRACYLITTVAVALMSFMAVGEFTNILAHHSVTELDFPFSNPVAVGARLLSFTTILFLSAYFTTLVVGQLRKSQSQLCRAGKLAALGEIIGQIAHEINNPVAIIAAKAKLLRGKLQVVPGNEAAQDIRPVAEKAILDLEKIDTHAERIASITKGLLAFCRPSMEKKTAIDLNQVVKSTLNLLDKPTPGNISFKINLAGKPLWVDGNFNELQQVVLNLVNNAIDAMPDGGELKVATLANDKFATISLTDNGAGITPENIPFIFDPFFTTKPEGRGTGLGLSISHGIVQDHKGHIDVESTPNRGSTFTIRLPLRAKEPRHWV